MLDELDIRHIEINQRTLVQLFKLPQQIIDYLWERIDIAKKKKDCHKKELDYVPKISHSYKLEDPQNLLVPKLYDILFNPESNPKMFKFINSEVQRVNGRVNVKENILEPYLDDIWVNFQKKGEFIPLHAHVGMFSFVIWMEIPYHYEDESKLPFTKSRTSGSTCGNFSFAISDGTNRTTIPIVIDLSPNFNGYCCFFPSDLSHQVYPFYTSDKERISISGNISYRSISKPNPPPVYQFPFHMSGT
jgi:hypothetical protein